MEQKTKTLNVSVKSFLTAIVVVLVLMVGTYVLTCFIPGGEYVRVTDGAGNAVIDAAGGFSYVEGGLPFWKWILSPILVLGAEGADWSPPFWPFCWSSAACFRVWTSGGL